MKVLAIALLLVCFSMEYVKGRHLSTIRNNMMKDDNALVLQDIMESNENENLQSDPTSSGNNCREEIVCTKTTYPNGNVVWSCHYETICD